MSLFSFYLEYYNVLYFFYDDFSNWWNTFKLGPTLILSFSHSSFVFSEFSNNFSSLYLLDISYSLPVIVSSSFFGRCSTGHLLIAVLRRLQHTGSKNIFDVSGCAGPVLYPFSRPSVPFLWHMIRCANWTFIMQIRARPRSSSARIAGKKPVKMCRGTSLFSSLLFVNRIDSFVDPLIEYRRFWENLSRIRRVDSCVGFVISPFLFDRTMIIYL